MRLRPTQLAMFLKALLGEEYMEALMMAAIKAAKEPAFSRISESDDKICGIPILRNCHGSMRFLQSRDATSLEHPSV
jgi:hypothetical protein